MSDLSDDSSTEIDDVQKIFNKAAEYIQLHHSKFSAKDLLKFYALYKQATVGKCNTPRPGMFNAQGRAKWDAWNNLDDLEQSKAMEMYIVTLQTLDTNWNQQNQENLKEKPSQWVCTSTHAKEVEEDIPEMHKTPFDYIRENNLMKIKEVINTENVNKIKDEDEMFLIHWAVDRNTPEILEYFISLGVNVNSQDSELQTPLHYAATCGHLKCIQVLLDNNADRNILDKDGLSCLDVAYDDTIRMFLMN